MPRLAAFAAALLLTSSLGAAPTREAVQSAVQVLSRARDPAARACAASLLGEVADEALKPAARAALVAALGDVHAGVRRHAAAALSSLPAATSRVPLEAALAREKDVEVVPALLLALGALHEPGLVARLAAYRREASPNVRAAAVTAVADAGGEAARAVLLEVLSDPGGPDGSWSVRSAAILGLGHVGRLGDVGPVLEAMGAAGGWGSWLARSALAAALPRIDPAPRTNLDRLLVDQDERVALTAAESVWQVGGEPALLGLLEHPAPTVRAAAASASALRGVVAARSRLVGMAYHDASGRTRWSASIALFRLELPEGDRLLLLGVQSPEPAVWAEALALLEARTGARHGNDLAAWRRELDRWRQGGRRGGR